tara:strand:- start:1143 stop:1898 length:756 start_codon:yes stop_codon:yes gene_type:complete
MGFKLNKSSDNLFHKVSESKLDGGKVTQQPDVAMEAPSSPAKLGPIGTGILGAAAGYFAKKVFGGSDKPAKPPQKKDLSMTPHSSKDGKGTIHGPKVSYDMAYNKAKKTKQYANMSKDEYVTEAKRQTANFKKTGKWDASGASKPRKKVEAIATTIKPAGVQPVASKPTATVEIKKPVQAAVSKPAKQTRSQKLRSKGEAVLSNDKFSTAKKQRKSKRIRKRYDKAVAKEQKNENKKTKKSSSPDYSGGMM